MNYLGWQGSHFSLHCLLSSSVRYCVHKSDFGTGWKSFDLNLLTDNITIYLSSDKSHLVHALSSGFSKCGQAVRVTSKIFSVSLYIISLCEGHVKRSKGMRENSWSSDNPDRKSVV